MSYSVKNRKSFWQQMYLQKIKQKYTKCVGLIPRGEGGFLLMYFYWDKNKTDARDILDFLILESVLNLVSMGNI